LKKILKVFHGKSAGFSQLSFENEHEALGAMYVIEGSTLGGNVIAKQLSKTEGFDDVTFNFSDVTGKYRICGRTLRVLDTEVSEKIMMRFYRELKNCMPFF
jgi:hypothetical protein